MFLLEVTKAFRDKHIPYAVVGGYAMAFQGLVRATVDVDIVMSLKAAHLKAAEVELVKLGLTARVPVTADDIVKFRKEYIEKRNLLAWSFVDFKDPSKVVDILIALDLSEIQTTSVKVAGQKVVVATLESLMAMKMKANRPQDKVDIENIKRFIKEKNSRTNS